MTPQQVLFPSGDGMMLHGQLFLPNDSIPGKHPAVVFFHGGSRRQMLLGWHYMYYYSNAYAMNQFLASRGFVVLAVNYRSGIGYGLNFREAIDYGATGGSEYNDVQGAGLFLRGRADVDPAHIGAWGGSYGGYLTALALARSSDIFAAGVDMHGVHDWNLEWETFVPGWRILKDQEARRTAFLSLPMAYESTWKSPGAPDSGRRRSQRLVQSDRATHRRPAKTGRRCRTARVSRRGARFSSALKLARGVHRVVRLSLAQAREENTKRESHSAIDTGRTR